MQKRTIIQIAAAAENNALGKDNQLLWHLPDDFKHFKDITSGHYIIMGRKTFESFPKPLPNRTHVIITRNKEYKADGCIVVNSIEQAIEATPVDEDVFVVGGAEIYLQALKLTDKIELTRVHQNFEADAFFPELNENDWQMIKSQYHPKDEKHVIDFTFQTFVKK